MTFQNKADAPNQYKSIRELPAHIVNEIIRMPVQEFIPTYIIIGDGQHI
jgi:hypothetical protein